MKSEMVSVIVAIYNVENFVSQCIESIVNQQYLNLEIILVDDGSQDASGRICDEYAKHDKRIKVLHISNGGVSNARNTGINYATGKYICFIDGDDYISKDYVGYFVLLISANNADVAYSEYYYTFDKEVQNTNDKIKVISGEEAAIQQLCYRTNIGVWNKIFSHSLLDKGIRFISNQYIGEGFNFNVSAFQNAEKVAVGKKKVYFYRQDNSNSATKKFSEEKWKNGLQSIQDIKDNMIVQTKAMNNAWKYAYWRTYTDIYILIILNNATDVALEIYSDAKRISKQEALCAFKTDTTLKDRLSAILFAISPKLIFLKINLRRMVIKFLQK